MGAAEDTGLEWPALSPDGLRVAVGVGSKGNRDIWILDGLRPRPPDVDELRYLADLVARWTLDRFQLEPEG